MKSLPFILTLGFVALLTLQCNWSGGRTADLKFSMGESSEPKHTAAPRFERSSSNPETLGKMHCFFISVAGSGIVPSVGSAQLNSRKPDCFGFGTTSKGIKLTELTSEAGYRFRIPLGPNRQVSVFGAYSSTLGTTCTGKEVADLFGYSARPRIYLLGRTTTDLYRDSVVDVINSYDSANANDLAETCPIQNEGKPEPDDPTAQPPLRGSRLLVASEARGRDPNLASMSFDETGALVKRQEFYMSGSMKKMQINADRTLLLTTFNFLNFARGTINAQLYRLETQGDDAGNFTLKGNFSMGIGSTEGFFTIDPRLRFAYYAGPSQIDVGSFTDSALATNGDDSFLVANLAGVVATSNFVYSVSADPIATNTKLSAYTRSSTTGALTSVAPTAFSAASVDNYISQPLWDGADMLYFGMGTSVRALKIAPSTGSLIQTGSLAPLPLVTALNQMVRRMLFDSSKTKLYVLTQETSGTLIGASGGITIFERFADGSLNTSTVKSIPLGFSPQDFAVDPEGKFAFIADAGSRALNLVRLTEANPVVTPGKVFDSKVLSLQMIPIF